MAPESVRIRIPNLDAMADYIDRLAIEIHKTAWLENRKREEQAKEIKDTDLITRLDNLSRDANELRSQLKNRINELFEEILRSGEYKAIREVRTFRPPGQRLADAIADRFHDVGDWALRGGIATALARELGAED